MIGKQDYKIREKLSKDLIYLLEKYKTAGLFVKM
jgi:hypothetical protein